jgi:hypothetical protein
MTWTISCNPGTGTVLLCTVPLSNVYHGVTTATVRYASQLQPFMSANYPSHVSHPFVTATYLSHLSSPNPQPIYLCHLIQLLYQPFISAIYLRHFIIYLYIKNRLSLQSISAIYLSHSPHADIVLSHLP